MSKNELLNQEDITLLSELKSTYSCFDDKEEPYYNALSKAIMALRAEGDLISRSALKKAFEEVYPLAINDMGGVANKRIYDLIDRAPAVDTYTIEDIQEVQENSLILGAKLAQRPEGKWIRHDPDETNTAVPMMECSCCHKTKPQYMYPALFYSINQYCNWCGAKMIQGDEGGG